MYRKITIFLEYWKNSKHRKPLILQGARQVGKTYSVLEFGRTHYENTVYFNFDTNPKLKQTFDEDISPEYLVATVYKGNIIKNLIMDCQSYTKYRPNETTGGIFVSWRRKEELPTGA
jgi:predicted AAA+ superfamily ATPase